MNEILFWNCRGAGSPKTLSHLLDMIKCHRPSIVALLETRVQSDKVATMLDRTHLTDFMAVEARGFAGGIWLAWDNTEVQIEVLSQCDQAVNALVTMDNGRCWFLTVIYASPNPFYRRELWQYLSSLGHLMTAPWVALGDFNQVLAASEKQGGRSINQTHASLLQQAVDDCKWVDLGFHNPRFTWTNGRKGLANIKERLDRVWCNVDWHSLFTAANIHHLPRTSSDHHPVLVEGLTGRRPVQFKGFQFLEPWLRHADFGTIVHKYWQPNFGDLADIMKAAKEGFQIWNTQEFGNIFQRKKRCKARILGI